MAHLLAPNPNGDMMVVTGEAPALSSLEFTDTRSNEVEGGESTSSSSDTYPSSTTTCTSSTSSGGTPKASIAVATFAPAPHARVDNLSFQ
jgi:hypothetical protein